MDRFTAADLRELTSCPTAPCVSLYLPTYAKGTQAQQDQVRLKNLLRQAEKDLADGWLRPIQAKEFLCPAWNLVVDEAFWRERRNGLAIFVSQQGVKHYRVAREFREMVFTSQRFYLKPLLPLLAHSDRYFVLTISHNRVGLLAGTQFELKPVEIPDLPANIRQALNYDGAERVVQSRSGGSPGLGKQGTVYHGQGSMRDSHKSDLIAYFRLVDAVVVRAIGKEDLPMVLVGVDYLLPLYRQVNHYAQLMDAELPGNYDQLGHAQLLEKVWPLVEPAFQRRRNEMAERFARLAGSKRTSNDITEIVVAAYDGRIDALFVDHHAAQWGTFDTDSRFVDVVDPSSQGAEELYDLAAVQTLLNRGDVFEVDLQQMPGNGSVAAVFRY